MIKTVILANSTGIGNEFFRRRRQISFAQEVSVAEDDLGRGGDGVLLQGAQQERPKGVLLAEQVSHPGRETGVSETNGADAHAGLQLVQEQAAKGSDTAV